METTKYETGRLGMSEPEISAEMESLRQLIMTRDPEAQANRIAYFYLHTPQEIHRVAVLNAMRMATSCLVYRDFGGWLERRVAYMRPYNVRCNVPDPKFLGTEEQQQAHALTVAELGTVQTPPEGHRRAQCRRSRGGRRSVPWGSLVGIPRGNRTGKILFKRSYLWQTTAYM